MIIIHADIKKKKKELLPVKGICGILTHAIIIVLRMLEQVITLQSP